MRAQGSLEYLIIIGVVISITAVITLLTVTYFGGQQEQYYYTSCQQAAATCKILLSADESNPCAACNTACNLTDGTEIFDGAIECCKCGLSSKIYDGSPGCKDCQIQVICNDGDKEDCRTTDNCEGERTCFNNAYGLCQKTNPFCECGSSSDCETGEICCSQTCEPTHCTLSSQCPVAPICYVATCQTPGECTGVCSTTPLTGTECNKIVDCYLNKLRTRTYTCDSNQACTLSSTVYTDCPPVTRPCCKDERTQCTCTYAGVCSNGACTTGSQISMTSCFTCQTTGCCLVSPYTGIGRCTDYC